MADLLEDLIKISDEELVKKTQGGDPQAFDVLVKRYEKKIYSLAYNILLHHDDTNDALIESFVRAYKNIHQFRFNSSFYTWLYRVATNCSLQILKSRKRRIETLSDSPYEMDEEKEMALEGNPSEGIERKELQKKLNKCLAKLSKSHRTVVSLFDIEGLSHGEIAKILRCSEGTVRSRLHYAHKQLQKMLKKP